jgi:hypothetical protein
LLWQKLPSCNNGSNSRSNTTQAIRSWASLRRQRSNRRTNQIKALLRCGVSRVIICPARSRWLGWPTLSAPFCSRFKRRATMVLISNVVGAIRTFWRAPFERNLETSAGGCAHDNLICRRSAYDRGEDARGARRMLQLLYSSSPSILRTYKSTYGSSQEVRSVHAPTKRSVRSSSHHRSCKTM